ncbi:hypothetical protein [Lewinella sp. 4G2]|uniref:hypothetical protein n=1 Tax=Lewinella sp. 4G2 TaxID=1803372 RepID=UPI0007B4BACB|nr:hypothetical protein [Lewinella sp. 4G2]OAV45415.1 hypothetical protein A3850_013335 [Lewinella sp. 4G2]
MATTTTPVHNSPDLTDHTSYDIKGHARKFGIILGVLTAVYLIVLNLIYGEIPLGMRFAKHLIIIPVVWYAAADYAKRLPEGKVFKAELTYLLKLAGYAGLTLFAANIVTFMVSGNSFEQFMQEGDTFAGMMINGSFLFFETVVFVMIFAFIVLQGMKGKGSPED